jgi:lipid II:glycine glycyltransferase (peptidoglycan interpeptide bridge formation enzyme)
MTETFSPAVIWDQTICNLPGAHLLQTWEWGYSKSHFSWQPMYVIWRQDGAFSLLYDKDLSEYSRNVKSRPNQYENIVATALILQRNIPIGGFAKRMCVLYVPKGPLVDWAYSNQYQKILSDLQNIARQRGAIFIKIDPDVRIGTGIPGLPDEIPDAVGETLIQQLRSRGWLFSQEQVQFRNTCLLELSATEEQLLARMKQKTRYNIHLAEKKGVIIRYGGLSDISTFYQMYAETSLRDGFIIRDENYYQVVMRTFLANPVTNTQGLPIMQPLIAEVDGKPVAAVVIFIFAGKAWYLYGMSRVEHRAKMPNHLLQWEAIRLAKRLGCHVYDLWGAPDQFEDGDPMWGVYRFKEGFGAKVVRHIGAWDYPVQPIMYRLYTQTLPNLLNILRQRQKHRTQRMVG